MILRGQVSDRGIANSRHQGGACDGTTKDRTEGARLAKDPRMGAKPFGIDDENDEWRTCRALADEGAQARRQRGERVLGRDHDAERGFGRRQQLQQPLAVRDRQYAPSIAHQVQHETPALVVIGFEENDQTAHVVLSRPEHRFQPVDALE